MPQLVYLQIGSQGLEAFHLAVASVRRAEPGVPIVLYTDQPDVHMAGVEIRPWRVEGAADLARCGTASFGALTVAKVQVMRDAVERVPDFVIFSDVDVVACKPFLEAARDAARLRPVSVSSEGDARLPAQLCTGFLILRPEPATRAFLDAWEARHLALLAHTPEAHDQTAFNHLVHSTSEWDTTYGALPVMFTAPGWLFEAIAPLNLLRHTPYFFHANWLFEAEEKAPRMRAVRAVYERKPRGLVQALFRAIRVTLRFIARRTAHP